MAYEEITALLGGWKGFELVGVERTPATAAHPVPAIVLTLRPVRGVPKRCSQCGEILDAVHDVTERRVRDLPIRDAETWLVVPRARLACPRCGPTVEAVPWLDRYQRVTTQSAEAMARLAQVLPIKHVAQWFSVGWETVKQIDQRALERRLGPVDQASLREVRGLALDEFAIQRGQRYATVVLAPTTKRVLWVGRGAGREAIRPFFELLGAQGRAARDAVGMDTNGAYEAEVRAPCPHTAISYDLFHVVATYGHEVIDRVRVDEANRLGRAAPDDPVRTAQRRVIKGPLAPLMRWLLLSFAEDTPDP